MTALRSRYGQTSRTQSFWASEIPMGSFAGGDLKGERGDVSVMPQRDFEAHKKVTMKQRPLSNSLIP